VVLLGVLAAILLVRLLVSPGSTPRGVLTLTVLLVKLLVQTLVFLERQILLVVELVFLVLVVGLLDLVEYLMLKEGIRPVLKVTVLVEAKVRTEKAARPALGLRGLVARPVEKVVCSMVKLVFPPVVKEPVGLRGLVDNFTGGREQTVTV
jgi:hypothetical protein